MLPSENIHFNGIKPYSKKKDWCTSKLSGSHKNRFPCKKMCLYQKVHEVLLRKVILNAFIHV